MSTQVSSANARSTPGVLVAGAALLAALGGCTQFKDDGGSGLAPREAGPPCRPMDPFGPPSPVPGLAPDPATGIDVSGVRLLPDSLTAYFAARGRPGSLGSYDLYIAARWTPTEPFGNIQPLLGSRIDTSQLEMDPSVSGDNANLVFTAAGPDGQEPAVEYAVRPLPLVPLTGVRPALDPGDGGTHYDTTPFLREDGHVLYFASDRTPQMGTDIFRSNWDGTAFGVPQPVEGVNSSYAEVNPVVTRDDLQIYFASDRPSGSGQYDMWLATREFASQPFRILREVNELKSAGSDVPTFVTSDGCTLYFTRSLASGHLAPFVATKSAPR